VSDDYFGRKVTDPYRWLEDLESPDTAAWVAAQNKVTFAHLDGIPQREAIRKRLTELWDYQRTGVPVLEAGQLWFQQNTGLQRQSPLYRQTGFKDTASQVIDPNVLSPDGSVAMAQWAPSPDGRWLAYTLAAGGSDVQDIHVRDLVTGKDAPDAVPRVKFTGITWTMDSKGFFYSRFKGTESSADFAVASKFHQVWYHSVAGGRPDRLVFERPENGNEGVQAERSDDGRWLFLSASSGTTNNRLWVADLRTPASPDLAARPMVVAANEDAIHRPVGVVGQTIYLYTTFQAPNGRIVAVQAGERSSR
jgi:prolyl oligopeptidase